MNKPRQPLGNQQPPPPGSCTKLTSARLMQPLPAHSNKMQSWTSQPRKSRSSCKNMQSIPGIKPKAPEGRVDRLDKRPLAPGQKHRVALR